MGDHQHPAPPIALGRGCRCFDIGLSNNVGDINHLGRGSRHALGRRRTSGIQMFCYCVTRSGDLGAFVDLRTECTQDDCAYSFERFGSTQALPLHASSERRHGRCDRVDSQLRRRTSNHGSAFERSDFGGRPSAVRHDHVARDVIGRVQNARAVVQLERP